MKNFNLGQALLLMALFAMLLFAIIWASLAWTSTDVEMSVHGWIALGLGTSLSLIIGCGLMALMFYSSRSGYDETASPEFRVEADDEQTRLPPRE
ncbi:hypothetical protein [Tardiphaga sp. P9-11]|uniref:hypothetical protein n=1 Tax=Tardiphaga sp. P9-11 TaxID=2024614 RepID=UPI0011F312F5|nr:hypothetical protein [Tardiphaga sp. P9-11]KAA0069999.1 hypothetical protein CIW50_27955 [Tardiphaga sp. P9-11]